MIQEEQFSALEHKPLHGRSNVSWDSYRQYGYHGDPAQNEYKNTGIERMINKDLSRDELLEKAVQMKQGEYTNEGAFVMNTMPTGRSADDKYIVPCDMPIWYGKVNNMMDNAHFGTLYEHALGYLQQKEELFEENLWAGADPKHRKHVRFLSSSPAHAAFADTMLIVPTEEELNKMQVSEADFTIIHAPDLQAVPGEENDGTKSGTAIAADFNTGKAVITGTQYSGEVKKLVFTYMNGIMPSEGVFPMHASAVTVEADGENGEKKRKSAIFFGLSGTGKTTLSSAPDMELVGDDEIIWTEQGKVSNIEGGCYPKAIRLNPEKEPQIYSEINSKGAIMENVVVKDGVPDFNDESITENTRGSFTLQDREGWTGMGEEPSDIFLLTADADGVLPPISKLNDEQTQYYYLLGPTSKVAGTEKGVTKPTFTCSPGFGGPFLPRYPIEYARMFETKLREMKERGKPVNVWLINTGWTGEAYDEKGEFDPNKRMDINITRKLISAAISGKLKDVEMETLSVFGLQIPKECPGLDPKDLNPENFWAGKKDLYDEKVRGAAEKYEKNFAQYEFVPEGVKRAGPKMQESGGTKTTT
jgi:phosphoenolpyruvate carboxykinase (ATP)